MTRSAGRKARANPSKLQTNVIRTPGTERRLRSLTSGVRCSPGADGIHKNRARPLHNDSPMSWEPTQNPHTIQQAAGPCATPFPDWPGRSDGKPIFYLLLRAIPQGCLTVIGKIRGFYFSGSDVPIPTMEFERRYRLAESSAPCLRDTPAIRANGNPPGHQEGGIEPNSIDPCARLFRVVS